MLFMAKDLLFKYLNGLASKKEFALENSASIAAKMSRGAIATNLILSGRVLSPPWLESVTGKGSVFFLSSDKIKKKSLCHVRTGSNF